MKVLWNGVIWLLESLAGVLNSKASNRHVEEDGELFLNIYIPGTPKTEAVQYWNQLEEYFPTVEIL